jgi:hypothetical protein
VAKTAEAARKHGSYLAARFCYGKRCAAGSQANSLSACAGEQSVLSLGAS